MRALGKAREGVLPYAVASGDRAYRYVRTPRGLVEVRVWPDGRTTYTRVDEMGRPTGKPRTGLVRAGGWRAQRRLAGLTARTAGLAAIGVAVVADIVTRVV